MNRLIIVCCKWISFFTSLGVPNAGYFAFSASFDDWINYSRQIKHTHLEPWEIEEFLGRDVWIDGFMCSWVTISTWIGQVYHVLFGSEEISYKKETQNSSSVLAQQISLRGGKRWMHIQKSNSEYASQNAVTECDRDVFRPFYRTNRLPRLVTCSSGTKIWPSIWPIKQFKHNSDALGLSRLPPLINLLQLFEAMNFT